MRVLRWETFEPSDGIFTADPGHGEEGRRQVRWKSGRIVAEVE